MSKARDLADLGGVTTRLDQVGNSDGALSNRNMVINGDFSISQRSTSVTGATSSGYATIDGTEMSVPLDEANRHYAEISKQVAAGTLTVLDAD